MSMHERRSEMRTCRTQRSMLERAVFGWPMPVPVWPMPCDRFRGVLRVGPCTAGGDEDRGDRLSQRDFRAESRHGVKTCSDVRCDFYLCSCLFGEIRFLTMVSNTQSHIHILTCTALTLWWVPHGGGLERRHAHCEVNGLVYALSFV